LLDGGTQKVIALVMVGLVGLGVLLWASRAKTTTDEIKRLRDTEIQ
jgi:nitrogen fixation-related uncharacterized protein